MPILGIVASAISGNLTSYESIATTTVGAGGTANVEFTSIPATYTHLQIRGIARGGRTDSTVDQFIIYFNNATTNYYQRHSLEGYGSTSMSIAASAESTSTKGSAGFYPSTQNISNLFAGAIIDILDYANTNKNKVIRSLVGFDANGSSDSDLNFNSSLWINTSAITSIKIECQSGTNIQQYSQFALYGIKGS